MKTESKTTIAINLGHKFVAIEAELVGIKGITLALHKTPGKSSWSVSDPRTGLAIHRKAVTKEAALHEAAVKIGKAGVQAVQNTINTTAKAPAVDTLEAYVAPVKQAPTINPAAVCCNISEVSGVDVTIIRRVICSKGKNIGRLLGTCPPVFGPKADKVAAAVWLGLQPNPFKVSVGKVLFLDKENQELALRLGKIKWPSWLDSDRAALESFGVW